MSDCTYQDWVDTLAMVWSVWEGGSLLCYQLAFWELRISMKNISIFIISIVFLLVTVVTVIGISNTWYSGITVSYILHSSSHSDVYLTSRWILLRFYIVVIIISGIWINVIFLHDNKDIILWKQTHVSSHSWKVFTNVEEMAKLSKMQYFLWKSQHNTGQHYSINENLR